MTDILCMGEPMLEFNQQPAQPDGRRLYLEGFGGDASREPLEAGGHKEPVAQTAEGKDRQADQEGLAAGHSPCPARRKLRNGEKRINPGKNRNTRP